MKKLLRNKGERRSTWRRGAALLLALVIFAGALQRPAVVEAATTVTCKTLCKAALDATGGSSKLKYQTTKASDFPGFTVSQSKKASSIAYLCDAKEVYSICVVKASSKANAISLLSSLQSYQEGNSKSDYLSDYSATEQKVLKNAVCGRKGKYVWYIAMSTKKSVNKKGQKAIKGQL